MQCGLPQTMIGTVQTENGGSKPMNDLISRQAAIASIADLPDCPNGFSDVYDKSCIIGVLEQLPSAQPEQLTDDDFETIRIHLNAQKEKLCNQQRWKEAEEYQRIIDRFMAFASAQPERKKGKWISHSAREGFLIEKYSCSVCNYYSGTKKTNFCPNCGADMREESND